MLLVYPCILQNYYIKKKKKKEMATQLQQQLQKLFDKGGFLLRKWNSSETIVLKDIAPELLAQQPLHTFTEREDEYTKTLGIEWNAHLDQF